MTKVGFSVAILVLGLASLALATPLVRRLFGRQLRLALPLPSCAFFSHSLPTSNVWIFLLDLVAISQDDYINLPDPSYSWTLVSQVKSLKHSIYYVNMTSQTWLSPADSSRSVWYHWLAICVPDQVRGQQTQTETFPRKFSMFHNKY